MFFSSRLIIVPKYNAVLAFSETHDCGLDVPTTLMRLFNTYLEPNTYPDYSGIYAHAFGLQKNHNHKIKYGCARQNRKRLDHE